MEYIGSHQFRLTPTHIGNDWESSRAFQQSVKSISLNLKTKELSFSIFQREDLGILDYLWSFVQSDKVHFQLDAMSRSGSKLLFSLVMLGAKLKDHELVMDSSENTPATHRLVCQFKTAVRVKNGQIVCTPMQEEADLALAKLVFINN